MKVENYSNIPVRPLHYQNYLNKQFQRGIRFYFIIENPLKKGAFCYICRKTNCFGISAIVSIKFKNNYEINFKNL